jgi:predicted kinase
MAVDIDVEGTRPRGPRMRDDLSAAERIFAAAATPSEPTVTELFMITGPAGSGKTTFGVALAERLGAVSLDLDDVTEPLVSIYLADHPGAREAETLTLLREARYEALAAAASTALSDPRVPAVVLIAPFTAEVSSPERLAAWLGRLGVVETQSHVIWLSIPSAERLRRLESRAATRDITTVASGTLPEPTPPQVPAVVVDARRPVGELVDEVVQRFGNG